MLAQYFGITGYEIGRRLNLYRLSDEDFRTLVEIRPVVEGAFEEITTAFYDHLQRFPEVLEKITAAGSSIQRLKQTNPSYLRPIFAGFIDQSFFESRLVVGKIHAEIGITPLYFFAGYASYIDTIFELLHRELGEEKAIRAARAIQKVFNLDQQIIMESYGEFVFVKMLRTVTNDVLAFADELSRESQALNESADSTGRVAKEVQLATSQVAEAVTLQAHSASQISTAMTMIDASTNEVSSGAKDQRSAIQRASSSVAQIQDGMEDINRDAQLWHDLSSRMGAIESLKRTIEETSAQVAEMLQQSKAITNITKAIAEIASQTNLLSLNAAIEAARAGEHGRGFGVVADEVRKLAEKSAGAASEITELIGTIQQGSELVSGAMKRTMADVGEVLDITGSATSCLEKIATTAENTSTVNKVVTQAMEEVNMTTEAIQDKIEEALQHKDTVTLSVEQIAATAEENAAATEQMAASSAEAEEMVDRLVGAIARMIVSVDGLNRVAQETNAKIDRNSRDTNDLQSLGKVA